MLSLKQFLNTSKAMYTRRQVKDGVPDADTLMNATKGLKDEQTGVLNKILKASNQEEVIHKHLKDKRSYYCKHRSLYMQSIHSGIRKFRGNQKKIPDEAHFPIHAHT